MDFTGKKVVFVVVIFKIEVARDFYVTKQRISTSCGVWRLLGCSRKAPSAALRLLTVACIAARNQTFASYLSLKLSVFKVENNSLELTRIFKERPKVFKDQRSLKLVFKTLFANSVSFHFTQTFPKKVRVVSDHALLKSFVQLGDSGIYSTTP